MPNQSIRGLEEVDFFDDLASLFLFKFLFVFQIFIYLYLHHYNR